MPLFLMGCFPVDFQEVKRPLRTKSVKRPIKVGKRPIDAGKRPIKAMVLVGISVGCLMGCFWTPPPWWKTAPLKGPIKRSMINVEVPRQNSLINCQNSDPPPPPTPNLLNRVSVHFPKSRFANLFFLVGGAFPNHLLGNLTRRPHLVCLGGGGTKSVVIYVDCVFSSHSSSLY